jgi:predicted nucleotidyltransferase
VSIDLLELAASTLDDLLDRVVFVGGATITLWITDPGAPAPRPTKDVDVVVEVTSRLGFHAFESSLRKHGFAQDEESQVICRWRHRATDLLLDAMPADARILGFANRWQQNALPHAVERRLPSGADIRAIPPPYLLATKIEAFNNRGSGDFLASPDFDDIITLIDGRQELIDELNEANEDLRRYLAEEVERLTKHPRFNDGVFGALRPDTASQARAETVVLPALREIASLAP